jgi:hypothetical protein
MRKFAFMIRGAVLFDMKKFARVAFGVMRVRTMMTLGA